MHFCTQTPDIFLYIIFSESLTVTFVVFYDIKAQEHRQSMSLKFFEWKFLINVSIEIDCWRKLQKYFDIADWKNRFSNVFFVMETQYKCFIWTSLIFVLYVCSGFRFKGCKTEINVHVCIYKCLLNSRKVHCKWENYRNFFESNIHN